MGSVTEQAMREYLGLPLETAPVKKRPERPHSLTDFFEIHLSAKRSFFAEVEHLVFKSKFLSRELAINEALCWSKRQGMVYSSLLDVVEVHQ